MGTAGVSIRNQVRALISDTNIRSIAVITPVTITSGGLGGYESPTETEGTSRNLSIVPSRFIKNRVLLEQVGDIKAGDIRMLLRDDETVNTGDKISYNDDTYNVRVVNKIDFNEETVAQIIDLSKVN